MYVRGALHRVVHAELQKGSYSGLCCRRSVPCNTTWRETQCLALSAWYQSYPLHVAHLHFPFWAKTSVKYWSDAEFWIFITCLSNKLTCTLQFPLLALLFSAEILVSLHSGGSKSICSAVSWGTAVSACRVFLPVWDLLRHNGWFTTPYALFGISPWRISTRSDNLILLRVYLCVTAAFL